MCRVKDVIILVSIEVMCHLKCEMNAKRILTIPLALGHDIL